MSALTETVDEQQRQREDRARWEKQFGWKVKTKGLLLPKGFTNRTRYWESDTPSVFDHTYILTAERDGRPGVLTMPYGFDSSMAKQLDKWCIQHGARWYINGWAWWNSATVAVVIVPTFGEGEDD